MGKSLVIVESPAKAKTIEKYLGKNFKVKASVGHVKDLPKSKLGVDVKKGFEPTYEIIATKKKIIEELRKAASTADQVYLALDPDREGEAIAWHVAEEIYKGEKAGAKDKTKAVKKPLHRVLFNEITKKAVLAAIANPIDLNKNLYEAQQARRILDRLVGYQVSPLLWDKVRRGLSAGRVQTVALRLICERERAIKAFNPEEYWTIEAVLEGSLPPSFTAKLASFEGKKFKIANEGESAKILSALKDAPHLLKSIVKKERRRNPYPPFITSRLQQDASQKLGYSAARTMMLAQQLYEGVDVGEGDPVGLITYMRTDSTRISDEALTEVRQFIEEKLGKDYLPEKPLFYKNKKSAQDAHEAIRPTSVMRTPESVKPHVEEDLFKLYELIWKRFVACQMTQAVFDQTTFEITAGSYGYRANGTQMKFAGFLSLYEAAFVAERKEKEEEAEEAEEAEKAAKTLPLLKEGETLKLLDTSPEQHFTEPPPKFNDASLIKELEELGIGRPSTYATILSTLVDKEYVKKEQRVFAPTDLGFIVNDVLIESFPDIFNVEFTAKMETELDEVEEGKQTCTEAVKDFYKPFQIALEKAKTNMRDIKRQEIATDLSCEKCNSPMVIKWGRRGEFLACTNYPECKYTREFERQEDGKLKLMKLEVTGELCSTCGSQMVIKSGRFGKFLACSKYPECKTTRAISTGITCPTCGGALAERRTKKGRTFYGCSQYPKCTFATWDKPLKEACPQCGSPTLVAKSTKAATTVKCPRENCDYTRTQN